MAAIAWLIPVAAKLTRTHPGGSKVSRQKLARISRFRGNFFSVRGPDLTRANP
jgi:hypothetical protein